ncbi:outer membrane lipoprotein-sorting protein [Halanaerobium hydrogeniformans]|uniref:Sigma E regulatory protein, MucB/RseB n=1 Tax=Halanaerobium hydrogeniformans TaxID=656519 RepID=E4RNU2_HALHG|nr:outer membrane lipoprotein-sorting protein [Halanaerobium hydrogeniformans]ADQ13770.1 putative sigma E regulatory protein, MucB/RseB [Halanaerobium hydrogeniformans]
MIKKLNLYLFISLILFLPLLFSFSFNVAAEELSAEQIMQRVDENEYIESGRMEAEMIIEDRGREIVKEMFSFIEGHNNLTEFTNPRDRGTRYLKLDDDLWMYFPDAEDLVRISGHMMREGMMGSDFSYEDALESQRLSELYNFELEGIEEINSREAYIISGLAREDKDVSYYERKIWVDKERFVILRDEYYSTGGRMIKELDVKELKEFESGRWFPVIAVMNDKLKEESQTTLKVLELEFDYDIPEGKISLEELQ